jgi:hypothetical protein
MIMDIFDRMWPFLPVIMNAHRDCRCQVSLDPGQGLAQRVQAHAALGERPGMEILEAEGASSPLRGFFPGLEPDPPAQLVGGACAGQPDGRLCRSRPDRIRPAW